MKGFSIVELLIAMLITLVVVGATLAFIGPAQDIFQVQPESADQQQRIRVGVDILQRDLLMAGAGLYAAGSVGPLHHAIASIMPYRAFATRPDPEQGVYFRSDTISLLFVASTPSQTTLVAPLSSGALDLDLDNPSNCPRSTSSRVCGFAAGDDVLVFDEGSHWDVFEVMGVDPAAGRLRIKDAAPSAGFGLNASVAKVTAVTYSAKADPQSGAYQLVRTAGLGAAQPVFDHLVKLEFRYFAEPQPPRLIDEAADETPPRATYGASPPPLAERRGEWPSGENCTFAVVDGHHEPRLGTLAASAGLVEINAALLSDGPWCPDASARNRFDADVLRIRRVRFTLRVQTAVATLRGPAGVLFMKGGTARAGSRYLPDMEIQLDVTPRNLSQDR